MYTVLIRLGIAVLVASLSLVSISYARDKNAPITILTLGDSLTAGYGINPKKSYPELVQSQLKSTYPKLKVINASISGSTTKSALSRLKAQLDKKPDILFLALGANDGLLHWSLTQMKKNLEKTIELAQKHKMVVVLAGMKLPFVYDADYRRQFETAFTDLAEKYSLIYMPFLLENVATLPHLNLRDGLHPNEAGHKIMAKMVSPFLIKAIEKLK
jgi:acyl-CoA thioesterase-1